MPSLLDMPPQGQGQAAPGFQLGDGQFDYAANAGVDLNGLYSALQNMGASPQQIAGFMPWMQQTLSDPSGQFGKYAHDDTVQNNLQKYLQTNGGDTNYQDYGADAGHGGWLSHHIGDVARGFINPLDAATGGRLGQAMGRIGGGIYDQTAGRMGGWMGDHVFGQHGALAGITRGLNSYSVGALTPGTMAPIESGATADYWQNRQHGMTARQALGTAASDGATIAATALTAGGAGPALGTLGNAAVNAGLGATSGAANAYASDGNLLRGAGIGAASSLAGSAGGSIGNSVGNAIGGTTGRIAGQTLGGAVSGATRAALTGGDVGQGAAMGGLTGLGSSAGGALGGQIAGDTGTQFGSQLGRMGAGYLGGMMFAPQQAQQPQQQQPGSMGLLNQPVQMPGGGLLMHAPTTGTQQTMPAYTPTLPPGFAQLYGQDQAQRLLAQMRF